MGKVYLVGAGPGDPELLTLKAYRLLQRADVVLYDALVNEDILDIVPPTAVKVFVGKRAGNHSKSQEEINELIYRYALLYPTVVRLKGGDPFLFGRGGEELLYLAERGIEFEVVPGVSSPFGAAAASMVPLTHRGKSSSLTITTGHPLDKLDWKHLAASQTLVILMGIKHRKEIAKRLIEFGKPPSEEVVFIEKATTSEERVIFSTLGEVASNPPKVETPALFIVGPTVGIGRKLYKSNAGSLHPLKGLSSTKATDSL